MSKSQQRREQLRSESAAASSIAGRLSQRGRATNDRVRCLIEQSRERIERGRLRILPASS